jgi:hypothetical protein
VGVLTSLCHWGGEGGKNIIVLVRAVDTSAIIALGGVRVPALGECDPLAIIMRYMMLIVAPASQARARMGTRARRRS